MNILVCIPAKEAHRAKLEKAAAAANKQCSFVYSTIKDVTEEMIADADVIIGNVPAGKIHASEKLQMMQLNSAGADPYIAEGVLNENTILLNSTGAYCKGVAEHGIALTLMLMKKLHFYRDDQQKSSWSDHGTVTSPTDAVVLVVGLGDIGLHYGKVMKALGAKVIGIKKRPAACPAEIDELYILQEHGKTLHEALEQDLLPKADIIFNILPGNSETAGLYDEELFAAMKNSAYFVNCGRGNAVDQTALAKALEAGELAGAGLDVTSPEPLPSDSPLWKLPNLVITPHISGGYHLPETFERIVNIAADNLEHFLKDEPVRNIVDKATGYKK